MNKVLINSGILGLCLNLFASGQDKPNVVFIMSDDLNDWVGAFGGNQQVITPNMDKFSGENAMLFYNAHCTAPLCGPSRSSLLSGFRPETTGCYGNSTNMLTSALVQEYATLPEYFSKNGYITISKGKIFHKHQTEAGRDHGHWAFDIWEDNQGNYTIQQDKLYSRFQGIYNGVKIENSKYEGGTAGTELAWAPTAVGKEETSDYLTAKWFAQALQKDYEKPFFMAVGIAKPHLNWFVPQEYFDMYDLNNIKIPDYRLNDLDDILTPSGVKKFRPEVYPQMNDVLWLQQDENRFKMAVRAYMATITYVDECIGVILDAIESSSYKDNTIIVIMGDHGWHLGEKLQFQKNTLWSESTRTPLIIRTPEMKQSAVCKRVVNFIDIFPTLIDVCGLPKRDVLEGRSFAPLINNPDMKWPYPSITTLSANSYTVNDENWRYTRYSDGTEELYNLIEDPMEWDNIVNSTDKNAMEAKSRLQKWMPTKNAPSLPHNKIGNRDPGIIRTPDNTIKATRPLNTLK